MIKIRATRLLPGITLVALLAVPKAGIYISGLPIYLLYLLIVVTLPFIVFRRIIGTSGSALPSLEVGFWMICLIFWSIWIAAATNGYSSVGFLVGQFFAFFLVPVFFVPFGADLEEDLLPFVLKTLVWAIRIVVVFGLLSWIYSCFTGDYINIPYVTAAGGEGAVDVWQKNNLRGSLLKLVSTYGNGNIFGVCMLMIAPVYLTLESKVLLKLALFAALFCTLSRTVWAGTVLLGGAFTAKNFVERKVANVAMAAVLLPLCGGAVFVLTGALGRGSDFLLDSSLGGRTKYVWMIEKLFLLPEHKLDMFAEIPYVSAYWQFGLVGLLAFSMFFAAPAMLSLVMRRGRDRGAKDMAFCLNVGLLLYIFCSLSDAALLFVPTFSIYMFLFGLRLSLARRRTSVYLPC